MSAGYDNLTATQQAEFDRLMTMAGKDWPDALKTFYRNQGHVGCGDQIADIVGRWVKQNVAAA